MQDPWMAWRIFEPYAPGKSIGGDYFTNRERVLPQEKNT